MSSENFLFTMLFTIHSCNRKYAKSVVGVTNVINEIAITPETTN
jgi:hypothetical protein